MGQRCCLLLLPLHPLQGRGWSLKAETANGESRCEDGCPEEQAQSHNKACRAAVREVRALQLRWAAPAELLSQNNNDLLVH